MKVLVTAARGKTGRRIVAALKARPENIEVRTLSRGPLEEDGVEAVTGDMDDPAVRAAAVAGVDAVIHYGPPMHPREVAMGTGMIDAAAAAGVKRFVFVSVIHPQIDDLINHQAKLRIEAHLINSGLDWTILRPQHYFQNVDPALAVRLGMVVMPYPTTTRLGHVDMNDLAEAAAKVAAEPGHSFAAYDIASGEHLSVDELAEGIAAAAEVPVVAREATAADIVARIEAHHPLHPYSKEAFHRLFGYYSRRGIQGNPNVLTWLLGRPPATYADYVQRVLNGREGPVGNG
jgi:uncharacterized protein YbjT (DUF2867 family)